LTVPRPAPEDALAVVGLLLLGAGLALVWVPAALIVIGVLLLVVSWRIARARRGIG
jgi:uncharacterized membrane protein